jgi:small Trp-rich protein
MVVTNLPTMSLSLPLTGLAGGIAFLRPFPLARTFHVNRAIAGNAAWIVLICALSVQIPLELAMPLAVVAAIILLLKLADIGPPANWSWFWVLMPFAVLALWWSVITPMIGWDKKQAEKKMKRDQQEAQAAKKKNRGF